MLKYVFFKARSPRRLQSELHKDAVRLHLVAKSAARHLTSGIAGKALKL
jgi:hypothetical protein